MAMTLPGVNVQHVNGRVGKFMEGLYDRAFKQIRNGADEGSAVIKRWAWDKRPPHAGQVERVKVNPQGNKRINSIDTCFAGWQQGKETKPFLRETISRDTFTKKEMADVAFYDGNGTVYRIVAEPKDPNVINFLKNLFSSNPEAKSLILGKF